eukprot:TRINITY_DN2635_c0_g2_i3.p1 TRINITY_DN2635_c0_g2~~TRINITY_DN2635_c0_g2_i3.p1  ORF type:complete len:132 (+),score=15.39 TRINITY_DN2635_c0_g2_i3:586-981(+)
MNLILDITDGLTPTQDALAAMACLAQSAFEDLHQHQRKAYAGGKTNLLDPRADDDHPSLLTKEEQQRLAKAPRSSGGSGVDLGLWYSQKNNRNPPSAGAGAEVIVWALYNGSVSSVCPPVRRTTNRWCHSV